MKVFFFFFPSAFFGDFFPKQKRLTKRLAKIKVNGHYVVLASKGDVSVLLCNLPRDRGIGQDDIQLFHVPPLFLKGRTSVVSKIDILM